MRAVLKSAALGFALFALLLRAALPDGWMPASAASAPLMPCPGMMTMPMTPHHGAPPQKHDGHTTICIFAAAGHFGSVPLPVPVPAPTSAIETAQQILTVSNRVSKASYRPNAARAPPLSV